jgi:AmmeMemoRadiSam system protein B
LISPHAGFEYSGRVAGAAFSSVSLPERFVIIGPNHRGGLTRFATMGQGIWETPLGDILIDETLAELIAKHTPLVQEDENSHIQEHSLEVQLPFIQYFRSRFCMVPIAVASPATFQELEALGKAIAKAIDELNEDVLIVSSTDMSHYVSQEEAKEKDFLAIERILQLDSRGLYDVVTDEDISMCGFHATTAAIVAAKDLGAKEAELIKYQTSGDITGNHFEVVGYAGIRIV